MKYNTDIFEHFMSYIITQFTVQVRLLTSTMEECVTIPVTLIVSERLNQYRPKPYKVPIGFIHIKIYTASRGFPATARLFSRLHAVLMQCFMLTLGNALSAQVAVPITRLPVECKLSRGQSMGSQDFWIRTPCVQTGKPGRGYHELFVSLPLMIA